MQSQHIAIYHHPRRDLGHGHGGGQRHLHFTGQSWRQKEMMSTAKLRNHRIRLHSKLVVAREGGDQLKANKQRGREWYLWRHKHPVASSEGRKQDLDHRSTEEPINLHNECQPWNMIRFSCIEYVWSWKRKRIPQFRWIIPNLPLFYVPVLGNAAAG